jgi:F-type H+-transporting ATPase subunit alpha
VPLEEQVIAIYAATNGYIDDIPVDKVRQFEAGLLQFMRTIHPQVGQAIGAEKDLSPATRDALDAAIKEYKQTASF